jgi:hypothetical protein
MLTPTSAYHYRPHSVLALLKAAADALVKRETLPEREEEGENRDQRGGGEGKH